MEKHKLPAKQRKNVEKQAQQIRYCLKLAQEYFVASRSVTSATKGVLQYYGVMNLAIAEFLFKQDGDSSLDRIRQKHRHHGLEFSFKKPPNNHEESFSLSAARLSSKPYINGSDRYGTFSLWQKTSQESPQVGKHTTVFEKTSKTKAPILAVSSDYLTPLSENGISLLDALTSLPFLDSTLRYLNQQRNYSRGSIQLTSNIVNKKELIDLVIQPHPHVEYQSLLERFIFPQAGKMIEPDGGGGIFKYHYEAGASGENITCPGGVQYTSDELFWYVEDHSLNEFGYIYVALHMLGNFSRYYPHYWISEIERSTELSVVCDHFMQNIELRASTLIYSELSGCLCLY